jgi:hypothetical protein
MKTTFPVAALAVVLAGGAASAQEAQEKAQKPQGPVTELKLQVVFSRYQGEKKVSSVYYTLPVRADGTWSRVHMGFEVPLRYESKESAGNVVFKDVGNSVDCRAQPADDAGRFKLECGFDQSSVHTNGDKPAEASLLPPVLRDFRSDVSFFLRDGQTSQITAATDPVSGDVVKVDVTLNVVK